MKCDECSLKQWIRGKSNFDLRGKPLLMICPHKDKPFLRGKEACRFFQEKEPHQRKEVFVAFNDKI